MPEAATADQPADRRDATGSGADTHRVLAPRRVAARSTPTPTAPHQRRDLDRQHLGQQQLHCHLHLTAQKRSSRTARRHLPNPMTHDHHRMHSRRSAHGALIHHTPGRERSRRFRRCSCHGWQRVSWAAPAAAGETHSTLHRILLGQAALAPATARLAPGHPEVSRLVAGSTGTASAIRVYVGTRSRATRIMVALDANKQGRPAQRLTSGSTSQIRQGAWNTVDIAPTRLRRGREYWLVVLGRGGALVVHEGRRGSCGADSGSAHGLGALPSSWNGRSMPKDCSVSGYVIGRASSGGPTATGTSGGGTGGVLSTNPGGTSLPNPPVTVPNPPGVPILAPHNTTAPSVSGSAVQGDTLTASSGSWTGSLSSYAYQWQDCSSSGTGCASIGGATRATYVLAGGEVGHEVRVVVTAVNGFGSTAADSGPSAVVTAAGPTQSANCFASPAACGFPDPHAGYPSSSYVGPQNGRKLPWHAPR